MTVDGMPRDVSMLPRRAGITVLEVLIAIGILAIGLTSVLSLIPLGRSLLTKAVVADHGGYLLDNARATVLTAGLANVDALTGVDGGPCPGTPLVIDPLGLAGGSWPAEYGLNPAVLRSAATLADATEDGARPRAGPVAALGFTAADDLLMTMPDNDDLPPANRFVNGVRGAVGRFSWFAVLAKSSTTPFVAGELATLSIVVCRNRVPGLMPPAAGRATPVSLRLTPGGPDGPRSYRAPHRLSWPAGGQLFPDRLNNEALKKGAIVLVPASAPAAKEGASARRPPQIVTVATVTFLPHGGGADDEAEITFAGDPSFVPETNADGEGAELEPVTLPVAILPDAVAVRDSTVTIEGTGRFSR